ncbi:hypothetical protein [Acinetobacter sp. S4397-1]|nr:hypothetical protein [Acinetobacter sp. S4397-1]
MTKEQFFSLPKKMKVEALKFKGQVEEIIKIFKNPKLPLTGNTA